MVRVHVAEDNVPTHENGRTDERAHSWCGGAVVRAEDWSRRSVDLHSQIGGSNREQVLVSASQWRNPRQD